MTQPVTHLPVCPQYSLLCTCSHCYPPPCLCAVAFAVKGGDPDALRLAFWDAVKAVEA